MTRFTDPSLDADDVVRRLRGALDELTADITETTVAEQPFAPVHALVRQSSRRTWIVPVAAAAVAAVFAGVVIVGNRDDGGPTGPAVSVPDTAADLAEALENATVAGTTFADLEGLAPTSVPTWNHDMTSPTGTVFMSADGPGEWYLTVHLETDAGLPPGTLRSGETLTPIEVGGRELWIEERDGGVAVHDWRPGSAVYVTRAFGLSRNRLVQAAAAMGTASGESPSVLDDPSFPHAAPEALSTRPTTVEQAWTYRGRDVQLMATTGGLAHLLDRLVDTATGIESVEFAGLNGYRVDTDNGVHVLWRAVGGADVWMSLTATSGDIDELTSAVVQRPTAIVVGGPVARDAATLGALNGWFTAIREDAVELSFVEVIDQALSVADDVPAATPVVIDALTSATVGEVLSVTRDLRQTRRIVLVTADETITPAAEFNDVLRSVAATSQNVVVADWAAVLADDRVAAAPEDWVSLVAEALSTVEDEADTAPDPDTTPPISGSTDPAPVPTDAPTTESTTSVAASTPVGSNPMEGAGFVVGASVTLGAAEALAERGFVVNADVSRQAPDVTEILQQAADAGILPDVVVIHPGTNGGISAERMASLVDAVADVPRVVVITDRPLRTWNEPNNELIRGLPAQHPNVVVLDWATLADACTGDCFASDGLHLDSDGRTYYADLVLAAASTD